MNFGGPFYEETDHIKLEWYGRTDLNAINLSTFTFLHRTDGPAYIIYCDGKFQIGFYYLMNNCIKEEDFHTPGFIDSFILENS
jgi:hypothetical protein